MVFDAGIATTYTLDPIALLTVPVHLAWLASGQDTALVTDGVRLLESVRRVGAQLTVYADRGRMQAPAHAHALYALLESIVVEVRAPGGGAFHPKLWVLRFVSLETDAPPTLRLAVLSRNLTADRCWDLALQLEGRPGGRYVAGNREMGELVRDLPSLAVGTVAAPRREQAERLADEVRRATWELPGDWDEVTFHVLGRKRRAWSPPRSAALAVMSPFVRPSALDALRRTTDSALALVSRPEELAGLDPGVRKWFARCLVLDEAAEVEDGEDTPTRDAVGFHAKGLVLRCGWSTRLFIGSVNATPAALLNGANIEVWAELAGKRSKVGGIEELLSPDGFGAVLTDFDPATPCAAEDPIKVAAEARVEAARAALVAAELSVRCEPSDGDWRLVLLSTAPVNLDEVSVTTWPLSLVDTHAVAADPLTSGSPVDFGIVATADVTGLVGFAVHAEPVSIRFALCLPVESLPADRDAAILRRVLRNRDGFLRYLLFLLGEVSGDDFGHGDGAGPYAPWHDVAGVGLTVLEGLVRAFAREPERLQDVRRVVERLRAGDVNDDIVPPDFLALWDVFVRALDAPP
jgi:hypothetical protein